MYKIKGNVTVRHSYSTKNEGTPPTVGEGFQVCPNGRRPQTHWRDHISLLDWEALCGPEELEELAGEREVSASLLRLLPV